MINFDKWLNANYTKLEKEYDEYLEMLDTTIIVPVDFTEFVEDRFEDFVSGYMDYKYDEMKDERC